MSPANIRPHFPHFVGFAYDFYASTVIDALAMARRMWPTADYWECLGSTPNAENIKFPATLGKRDGK